MLPGDRLVCAFVEPHEVGDTFASWPLHVTIVPWFRLDASSEQLAAGMTRALHGIGAFESRGADEAAFGPKSRRVRLLATPTPFELIELRVRTYLHKKRAWIVDETTKRHYEFRPHVTYQGTSGLEVQETFTCNRLYIVEQQGTSKQVAACILLWSD